MKNHFLTFFALCTIFCCSCGSSTDKKEAELLKREKELLEKEKNLLKKENLKLKSEQKNEQLSQEEVDEPQIKNTTFSEDNLFGFWAITMNCTFSDCEKNKIGNVFTENWQINKSNGKIVVKVSNTETSIKEYEGQFSGNTLTLKSSRTGFRANGQSSVKLYLQNDNELEGEREVLNTVSSSNICKIQYFLKAKRK
jgi:hypothetical protein